MDIANQHRFMDLEAIFYAKALDDMSRFSKDKQKEIQRLQKNIRQIKKVVKLKSFVQCQEERRLAKDMLCADKLFDMITKPSDPQQQGIESFQVGDIVVCGKDKGYAEILRLIPSTGKVMVAWLVQFDDDEAVEHDFCVELSTGKPFRWEGYMLSNIVQPEEESFHWEHIKMVDGKDCLLTKRFMSGKGIIDSYAGHDFEQLEDNMLESPEEVFEVLQGRGLGRRLQTLLDNLVSGNFSTKHSQLDHIVETLPTFSANNEQAREGICVWCNSHKTLTSFTDTGLGMGSACLEKYTHYSALCGMVNALRKNPCRRFVDDDVASLKECMGSARNYLSHDDDDVSDKPRKRLRRAIG
jgi:hypothetical protein